MRGIVAVVLLAQALAAVVSARALRCPEGQVFNKCGSFCELTCENVGNPPAGCIKACKQGCFCPEDNPVRLPDGSCGKADQCNPSEKCPGDLIWTECGSSCEQTCENQPTFCNLMCVAKCQCPPDRPIRLSDNKCGTLKDCDSGKKCPGDLVWNDCGSACDSTCKDPNPPCNRMCVPRCQCPSDRRIQLTDVTCGTLEDCFREPVFITA